MSLITPMRAADLEGNLSLVKLPCIASPKFDGYRATTQGQVLSKNNKPIPNGFVQRALCHPALSLLDGELVVGSPTEPGSLQRTSSGVTRREGQPDFVFWVFDDLSRLDLGFQYRLERLQVRFYKRIESPVVRLVPHERIDTLAQLEAFEARCVAMGYEGIMVRALDGEYKQGGKEPRATVTKMEVAKLKRVDHFEARVLEVYEQMENTNEATRDELGRTKRSTAKAGKRGKGVLGGCRVVGTTGRWAGVPFDVGNGWSDPQRAELWEQHQFGRARDGERSGPVVGRIMKCESGITPPTFKKPQFPRWIDWKWEGDL
jgi:DNA ligase-1